MKIESELTGNSKSTAEMSVPVLITVTYLAVRIAARGVPPMHEANIKRMEIPTWSLTVNEVIRWEEIN